MHFLTHEMLLFFTSIWTTNIHDNIHAKVGRALRSFVLRYAVLCFAVLQGLHCASNPTLPRLCAEIPAPDTLRSPMVASFPTPLTSCPAPPPRRLRP